MQASHHQVQCQMEWCKTHCHWTHWTQKHVESLPRRVEDVIAATGDQLHIYVFRMQCGCNGQANTFVHLVYVNCKLRNNYNKESVISGTEMIEILFEISEYVLTCQDINRR